MSTRYNVAIVGYSWAATAHIGAIAATSKGRVTDVMSSRPLDAEELSRRHGTPIRVHTDLDALLADPSVDVVDITGYPDQHAGQFIRAARAGKHIIIEKPRRSSGRMSSRCGKPSLAARSRSASASNAAIRRSFSPPSR